MSAPEVSVVVPVCNEETNVEPLAAEIGAALRGREFELLFIDDGSTDGTVAAVERARAQLPQIRLLQHFKRSGQSAALCSGMRAARAPWVATLDGDGQNDPADIPNLIAARDARLAAGADRLAASADQPVTSEVRLFMGHRQKRRDTWLRRISSRVANGVRGRMLRDSTPDTGCGIKLMHRATFLELPRFDHMHRFLPALYQRAGSAVISVPVNHRPRLTGTSKYGLFDRLWVGIVDIFGVMWLARRHPPPVQVRELGAAGSAAGRIEGGQS